MIRTDFKELQDLAKEYPFVEFGVLVGSKSGKGYPRYPAKVVVDHFKRECCGKINTAIHLCGTYSRNVMFGGGPSFDHSVVICDGFDRVQINAKKFIWDSVYAFADSVSCFKVVIPYRNMHIHYPNLNSKLEFLYDASGGQGKDTINQWPKPNITNHRIGYAGGISPDNIDRALAFCDRFPDVDMWLDMESGIRTNDWLDLNKVRQICEAVQKHSHWGKYDPIC